MTNGMAIVSMIALALFAVHATQGVHASPHPPVHDSNGRVLPARAPALAKPHATLQVISETPVDHLGLVTLEFDIPGPAGINWIGSYCVEDELAPDPDNQPLDIKYLNGSHGRVEYERVPNMRCSWQFRLFRTSGKKHYRLAHTNYVRMRRGHEEPMQVHLAVTGDATQMRVMWVSSVVSRPSVQYGRTPTALDQEVKATGTTYSAEDMCEGPARTVHAQFFRDPGQLYEAVMTKLEPGATYYYRVGSSTQPSPVFTFTASPRPGQVPVDRPQSFFVYGDMGDWDMKALGALPRDRSATTAELMRHDMTYESQYQWLAAVHIGDISYAKGRAFLWDQFASVIQPVAAELPYMVGVGNHDYCYFNGRERDPSGANGAFRPPNAPNDCSSGGECGLPLHMRYRMPDNGNSVFWYSFEIGLMHHTVLSTEHDYTPGSPMSVWLVNDLRRVDRNRTPWVFLHIHRPMYCSEVYESDFKLSQYIRKQLETVCAEFGVDVVFSGHYHAYERTCPVFQEQCRVEVLDKDRRGIRVERALAPVHIMVGSAGALVDIAAYYQVPWHHIGLLQYGYGRMHVVNATHARYEFKANVPRAVVDATWIVSDHKWHEGILTSSVDALRTQMGRQRPTMRPTTPSASTELDLFVESDLNEKRDITTSPSLEYDEEGDDTDGADGW